MSVAAAKTWLTPRAAIDAAMWARMRNQYSVQFAHSPARQSMHPRRDVCVSVARRVERYHYVSRVAMRIAALQRSSNAKQIAGMLKICVCLQFVDFFLESFGSVADDVVTTDVQDDGTLTFTLRDEWLIDRVFDFVATRNGSPWIAGSGNGGKQGSLFHSFTCLFRWRIGFAIARFGRLRVAQHGQRAACGPCALGNHRTCSCQLS